MLQLLMQNEKEKREKGVGLIQTLFIKELVCDKGLNPRETSAKLRTLREAGLIRIGRTINDNYIVVIEQLTTESNVY